MATNWKDEATKWSGKIGRRKPFVARGAEAAATPGVGVVWSDKREHPQLKVALEAAGIEILGTGWSLTEGHFVYVILARAEDTLQLAELVADIAT